MLFSVVLSIGIVGQLVTPMEAAKDNDGTATLIVVASDRSDSGNNEFLVMRAAGDTISWAFICAKGFTAIGIDPEGTTEEKGTTGGNSNQLRRAFHATLGEITGAAQPQRGKKQRGPCYFSLILIDSTGVRTCQLWSGKQQRRLVHGDDLKAVFSEVRKKVFGLGYMMPDLLQVGMNPDLGEPNVPAQGGQNWQTPKPIPPPGRKEKKGSGSN
ncbi:MAG: hypothetical protein K8T25_08350 [Planctomycetia bacterium]|nr:hypothetical protein [Planctomycetia bacterium]